MITNAAASSITIAENDGNGVFEIAGTSSTIAGAGGLGPIAVAVGDVSGDGTVDIVTANAASSDVTVFVGVGNGAFGTAQLADVSAEGLSDLQLADLDGDGALDVLAVASFSHEVAVLLSLGGGALGAANEYPVAGDTPSALAVGDLDGDGALDIVTADADTDEVSVLFGIPGGGTFELAVAFPTSAPDDSSIGAFGWMGRDPQDVALADLDGDGSLDILTANGDSKDVSVLRGDGSGGFESATLFEYLPQYRPASTAAAVALTVGDLDADGRTDVAVVDSLGRGLEVVAGGGDGRLLPAQTYEHGYTTHYWDQRDVAVGDMNGDGLPDFVSSKGAWDGQQSGRQLESGAFYWVTNNADGDSYGVAIADIDGDGGGERFVARYSLANVYPDGSASHTVTHGSAAPPSIVVADVTGDGALDLLSAAPLTHAIMLVAGTGGDAWGGPNPIATTSPAGGNGPVGLVAAEVSGDDHLDLISANSASGDLSVMLGLGNGAFADAVVINLGDQASGIQRVVVGDFNGDLRPDLAAVGTGMNSVKIAIGFGNGNFAGVQTFVQDGPFTDLAATDVNGDGIADLVLVSLDDVFSVVLSEGHTIL